MTLLIYLAQHNQRRHRPSQPGIRITATKRELPGVTIGHRGHGVIGREEVTEKIEREEVREKIGREEVTEKTETDHLCLRDWALAVEGRRRRLGLQGTSGPS